MPLTTKSVVSALVWMLCFSPAITQAQDSDDKAGAAQRTPDAIAPEVPRRTKQTVCESHLEVTRPGAHLRLGQVLIMVGPLLDGSYVVIPAHPGEDARISDDADTLVASLKWSARPVSAKPAPFGDEIYLVDEVSVTEPGGEHPEPSEHPMIVQVSETDRNGCPTEIDIHGFQHAGTVGQHGGRAHASGGP
ncbi:MAG: hypothetical protein AAGA33_11965 [Pseudomonadota bacterium]